MVLLIREPIAVIGWVIFRKSRFSVLIG